MSLAENVRLTEDRGRSRPWKLWGPYLAERQWGTVREDYSEGGSCWEYLPHDHARSRAYRWGEDGLLGFTDSQGRLAVGLALWNGQDPILKERLFGLTGPEGNHGEDCKELYYYLDSTPTHSHVRMLYKYPQREFPYARLVEENRARGKHEGEFELLDTGAFDEDRYFDVETEYAKASPTDLLLRVTVTNRGPEPATLHVLPQLWFRNTWSWGRSGDLYPGRPRLHAHDGAVRCEDPVLGRYAFHADAGQDGAAPRLLFTENETNVERLFGSPNASPWVKDAFHRHVVHGEEGAVNPAQEGTKAAAWYELRIPAGEQVELRCRLRHEADDLGSPFDGDFETLLRTRATEAADWHDTLTPAATLPAEREVLRQARAGLLCSKQYYYYDVGEWLEGDPAQPAPPPGRRGGRNTDWPHLNTADILAMPDKWEYPWFAAWDLAFHCVALAEVDPDFAKDQLVLLLREWYMHPNGQIPAYEFAFSDVNPPVHAWACWRVYKQTGEPGQRDRVFLARTFQKLMLNFTWWVNRKDEEGKHLFSGGFLGLDNIGVFDRSRPLPTGGHLEQADGTAWMAFYCLTMLAMALELAQDDPSYEDVATKFFEHFVAIADAINTLGGSGLWDEEEGFYYDQLHLGRMKTPLRVRSMVGLIPLFACEVLEERTLERLPDFRQRLEWFLRNRPALGRQIALCTPSEGNSPRRYLLALPSKERLQRVLRYALDETEFLSPHGLRSVSRVHREHPYVLVANGEEHRVDYVPGESDTGLFGGNSNWRGPVWFPLNYLLVESLERYHRFYGESLRCECPSGSGTLVTLQEAADEVSRRLTSIFVPGDDGHRPVHGGEPRYGTGGQWSDLVLFYEYFHGDTGRGVGASHQTGWTALVLRCIEKLARARAGEAQSPAKAAAKARGTSASRR